MRHILSKVGDAVSDLIFNGCPACSSSCGWLIPRCGCCFYLQRFHLPLGKCFEMRTLLRAPGLKLTPERLGTSSISLSNRMVAPRNGSQPWIMSSTEHPDH